MAFATVGDMAQTNQNAYILHDYLPKQMLRKDNDLLFKESIKKEFKQRTVLYVARQVAGLPTLFLAPTTYAYSALGGFAAGAIGGFATEAKWTSQDSVKKQWKDWMECTIILDPKYAKLEKTIEGTVAVANLVLAITNVPETGLYSGFTFGAGPGWTAGRWMAQKVMTLCGRRPAEPASSGSETEQSNVPYRPPVLSEYTEMV